MSEIRSGRSASGWRIPFQIKIENRVEDPPKWLSPILSVTAVIIALLVGALVIQIAGANPWAIYRHIAKSSLGSVGVLSDTLVKATPLILVGLACSIAFRISDGCATTT